MSMLLDACELQHTRKTSYVFLLFQSLITGPKDRTHRESVDAHAYNHPHAAAT